MCSTLDCGANGVTGEFWSCSLSPVRGRWGSARESSTVAALVLAVLRVEPSARGVDVAIDSGLTVAGPRRSLSGARPL